jgi:hypothetical protein
MNEGILYIATGEKYIKEVLNAAISCKKHNDYPIALITDKHYDLIEDGLFDQIILKEANYSYRDKLLIKYTPFEKTVFLDTDTMVLGNLSDLFHVLDYREFAIHQADEGYEFPMDGLCGAMPEFNTGVIAFCKSKSVLNLIDHWNSSFDLNKSIKTDQFHLKRILYESDVRYATFSSAYNFIVYYPNYVIQQVKILHGRPFSSLNKISKEINNIKHDAGWRRTFYPFSNNFFILYAHLNRKDAFNILCACLKICIGIILRPIRKIYRKDIGKLKPVKK